MKASTGGVRKSTSDHKLRNSFSNQNEANLASNHSKKQTFMYAITRSIQSSQHTQETSTIKNGGRHMEKALLHRI